MNIERKMKKCVQNVAFLVFCLTLLPLPGVSDSRVTRTQVVLISLHHAMYQYQDDHDGVLPLNWGDLDSYVEIETLEGTLGRPLDEGVKLLTGGNWTSPMDGRRLLAMVTIPGRDGTYDVLYERSERSPISPRIGTLSSAQLREIGLDPSGVDSPSEPLPSLLEREAKGGPSLGVDGKAGEDASTTLAEQRNSGETTSAKWPYFVVALALLGILVVVLHVRKRKP